MTRQRALVWMRVAFVVVMTPLLFVLLQGPARNLELRADVSALQLMQVHHVVAVAGPDALIAPTSSGWFWIVVSPSCSSLASVLTLGCLAVVLPRRIAPLARRTLALAAAAAAIFIGNLIRIDASIVAGVLDGRGMLVLFHDWVGSVFGFGYTMGGFILMLYLLLPARDKRAAVSSSSDEPEPGLVSSAVSRVAAISR